MRSITLQRLEVFRAVYEHESISAAARALKLSQPTTSRHLRDFEAAIGLTLFSLDRGRLQPTAEANALYAESRHLGDTIARLQTTITALQRGAHRPLSVSVVGPLAHRHFPRALEATLARMPGLQLSIGVSTAEEQIRDLRAGHVDLGFVAGRISCSDLEVEAIGTGSVVVLLPAEHPLAARAEVSHEEVASHGQDIRMTSMGPIGALVAEALASYEDGRCTRITVKSLVIAPQLGAQLRRPMVIDSFTAAALDDPSMVIRPLTPTIAFNALAIFGPQARRSHAAHELVAALRDDLGREQPTGTAPSDPRPD